MNQLESLKKFSTIVADTGDIQSIINFLPQDATTNPTLVLQTVVNPAYQYLMDEAIKFAKKIGGSKKIQVQNATNRIVVNIGLEILKYIPGRISTEVDARYSFDMQNSINHAEQLIAMYEDSGVQKHRVLIKLAATWEGIQAAKILKANSINCNLTLVFSFAQAQACADANIYLISPFVGRIYDWYKKNHLLNEDVKKYDDPGVSAVKKIFNYYKKYDYKTIIMAASFRKVEQILELAGCDLLTISPIFLKQLRMNNGLIQRKLCTPSQILSCPAAISESEFRFMHNQDIMAVEKLSEGIRLFANDQQTLENIIENKLL